MDKLPKKSSMIPYIIIIIIVVIILLCTFPLRVSPKIQQFFLKIKMKISEMIGQPFLY